MRKRPGCATVYVNVWASSTSNCDHYTDVNLRRIVGTEMGAVMLRAFSAVPGRNRDNDSNEYEDFFTYSGSYCGIIFSKIQNKAPTTYLVKCLPIDTPTTEKVVVRKRNERREQTTSVEETTICCAL